MVLKKRGKHHYGDSPTDIREEILRYSKLNGYVAQHFADATCACSSSQFSLAVDDDEGVAVRTCAACKSVHPIGDSADFLSDATPEECECPCGNDQFQITIGVSLYDDSDDVKWLYLGCRCTKCGLIATYGDWKNEYEGYQELKWTPFFGPPAKFAGTANSTVGDGRETAKTETV